MEHAHHECRHRSSREAGWGHVGQELAPGEMEVAEDDEVGEVRTGQQERTRIGEQQAQVQEGDLEVVAAAGGVDQHGSQERHSGVEVEHRRDGHDEHRRADIEHGAAPPGHAGEGPAGPHEETVLVGHHPDQEQTGDQHEGWPVLGRGGGRLVRGPPHRRQGSGAAESSQAPLEGCRGGGGDRRRVLGHPATPHPVRVSHDKSVPTRPHPKKAPRPAPPRPGRRRSLVARPSAAEPYPSECSSNRDEGRTKPWPTSSPRRPAT